jgi:hypothetical protein
MRALFECRLEHIGRFTERRRAGGASDLAQKG